MARVSCRPLNLGSIVLPGTGCLVSSVLCGFLEYPLALRAFDAAIAVQGAELEIASRR